MIWIDLYYIITNKLNSYFFVNDNQNANYIDIAPKEIEIN